MLKNLIKEEGGFTLVELLVTIAILAVLFGVVTLTLSGVGSDAEDTVKVAECGVVQSAADIYLAEDTTHTITARTTAAVITDSDTDAEFNGYLRDLPTSYTYTWTSDGDVTCPDVPTPTP
jgi:prepilin-type N-terminal cleavage/methylation domain-containing protein